MTTVFPRFSVRFLTVTSRVLASGLRLAALAWFALLLPATVAAEWKGGIEGGTVINDDGDAATRIRLKMINALPPWSHQIYVDWLRNADGDNGYEAGYLPRYRFGDGPLYLFGEARMRVDRPLLIERQQFLFAGLGAQWANSPAQSLILEVGAGSRNTEALDGTESDETIGLVRGSLRRWLGDALRLEFDADAEIGEEVVETTTETGLALRLGTGAIKVSYRTRRLSPEEGESVSDSDTFVSYNFGL